MLTVDNETIIFFDHTLYLHILEWNTEAKSDAES